MGIRRVGVWGSRILDPKQENQTQKRMEMRDGVFGEGFSAIMGRAYNGIQLL